MELKDFTRGIAPKPPSLNVRRSPYAPVTRAPVVTTAPTVASTVNMVRPSFPVFTQSAPSAQPAPVNNSRGFTTAPPAAPPPNFFDPAGWQQSLYDKVLSKILPSKETLDNSNFSFLNLLNPSNKITGKMIPEFIGNATLPGVAYNLAADAVKKFGLEDELAKYGPYAVAGGTAAGLVLNRNNPRGMAKITEGLTRGLVTNEIVKTISDITGVPWNAAAPTIFGAVNLNYPFRPPASVPAGLSNNTLLRPELADKTPGILRNTLPVASAQTTTKPTTAPPVIYAEGPVPIRPLLSDNTFYGNAVRNVNLFDEIISEKLRLFQKTREEVERLPNPLESRGQEMLWQAWKEVQIAVLNYQAAKNTPYMVNKQDIINQLTPGRAQPLPFDDEQYHRHIAQNVDFHHTVGKILSDANVTSAQYYGNAEKIKALQELNKKRENLHPYATEGHKKLVSLLGQGTTGLQDLYEIEKEFQRLGSNIGPSNFLKLQGAPTRQFIPSEQDKYKNTLVNLLEDVIPLGPPYTYGGPERAAYNYRANAFEEAIQLELTSRVQEMLEEVNSRPKKVAFEKEIKSAGAHKEAMDELQGARQDRINDAKNFQSSQLQSFLGYNPKEHQRMIAEETKKLIETYPEMYVGELGYLHNLETNFYSKINDFVKQQTMKKPIKGSEWITRLFSSGSKLPTEELKYIGIKDENKFQPDKYYTKEQMLDWLIKNGIKLKNTLYQQKDTKVSKDYNVNNIDTAIGTVPLLNDNTQMTVNELMPGGGPPIEKRPLTVLMVHQQGEKEPNDPWIEGHVQYNMLNKPIGRLEYESMAIGKGDKTIWLHEVQGPKPKGAKHQPAFLQYDSKGVDILLKRILMLAYKNGYTSIQWTNGATQMLRRRGGAGLGKIYDQQLVEAMNEIIKKTGKKMGYRARPDNPGSGLHPWLDLTSPEMQKFLSEPMRISKVIPQQGEEQRSIT